MTKMTNYSDLTRAFEAHEINNNTFRHDQHVLVAYELLTKYDYIDATAIYAKGIRTLATNAGAPHKFNATITFAFMSLIAERMELSQSAGFEEFKAQNPDLLSKRILDKWYPAHRLDTDAARKMFLMPTAHG